VRRAVACDVPFFAREAGASPFDRLRAQSEVVGHRPYGKRRELFPRHGLTRHSRTETGTATKGHKSARKKTADFCELSWLFVAKMDLRIDNDATD
jgi:hypothetical protein